MRYMKEATTKYTYHQTVGKAFSGVICDRVSLLIIALLIMHHMSYVWRWGSGEPQLS